MRQALLASLVGLGLATPALAQSPNVGQFLQGLTNGNRDQDQAVREAYERGYQRGRQDEARIARNQSDRGRRGDDDRDGYQGGPGERPYGQPGGSVYGR